MLKNAAVGTLCLRLQALLKLPHVANTIKQSCTWISLATWVDGHKCYQSLCDIIKGWYWISRQTRVLYYFIIRPFHIWWILYLIVDTFLQPGHLYACSVLLELPHTSGPEVMLLEPLNFWRCHRVVSVLHKLGGLVPSPGHSCQFACTVFLSGKQVIVIWLASTIVFEGGNDIILTERSKHKAVLTYCT